jgi:hypothetical protein
MYRVPPTTVSARIATATGRQAQVSDRRGETPVAVKRGARVSWFSFTGDRGFESVSLQRRVACEPDFLDEARGLCDWRRRNEAVLWGFGSPFKSMAPENRCAARRSICPPAQAVTARPRLYPMRSAVSALSWGDVVDLSRFFAPEVAAQIRLAKEDAETGRALSSCRKRTPTGRPRHVSAARIRVGG